MNNTLVLGLFLLVVYLQRLDWVYSSEVVVVVAAAAKLRTLERNEILLAAFVAAHTAVLAAGLVGEIALMVTSWDRHCPISHAHDFHDQQISNGEWDAPEGVPFEEPWSRTIEEFSRNINLVGEFIAAAQNLEEWTNAHC